MCGKNIRGVGMDNPFQRICVFCGSGFGGNGRYREAAATLGGILSERRITLVYGGARVGNMGVLANAVLAGGGRVTGIITKALLDAGIAHDRLTELIVTPSMHERKAEMAALSDAFIAMPGGFGTLEEIFEAITWAQLGLHQKPCGFLNVEGFYDPLAKFLKTLAEQRFAHTDHVEMVHMAKTPEALLDRFGGHIHPHLPKWTGGDVSTG
jgi:hypothetical protein